MKKNILIKITLLLSWLIMSNTLMANDGAPKKMIIKEDLILLIVAIFLAFPLIVLGKTVVVAAKAKLEKEKENNNNNTSLIILIFLLLQSGIVAAQSALIEVPKKSNFFVSFFDSFSVTTWILIFTILIEIIVIFYFSKLTVSFLQAPKVSNSSLADKTFLEKNRLKNWIIKKWGKMNNFKPIEREADIDTGHSYDGIRELDNPAPGWFKAAFLLSIIFAFVYLYRFHIAKSSPLQEKEYNIEMAEAEKEHQEYLKIAGDQVDENTVKLLAGEDVVAGKSLFVSNCAVCHGKEGEGVNAPNLTDKFWIHGGGLKDVFKSIKYGWQEKGMKSWKDDLKPKEIAQLTSFIKSISNNNIKSSRAAEGQEYVETENVIAIDTTKK